MITGYTPSARSFDTLIFGYYEGDQLIYVARTRNGFTPAPREKLSSGSRGWRLRSARLPTCRKPKPAGGAWGSLRRR